jgi:Ca2+-dependent lipid-binding protein
LLVNTLSDVLTLDLYDYNDHRKDTDMGIASFDLRSLNDDAEQEDIVSEVLLQGKSRGTIKFDLKFYPVMKAQKAADGTEEPLPESSKYTLSLETTTAHQSLPLRHWYRPYHASSGKGAGHGQKRRIMQSIRQSLLAR